MTTDPNTSMDGGQLARDIHSLLADIDPSRLRDDVEVRAREKLSKLRRRTQELLRRPHDGAVVLRPPLEQVATALSAHDPTVTEDGPARRAAWMRLRRSLLPAYAALASVLREHAVDVPPVRPTNWYRTAFHVSSAVGVLLLFEYVLDASSAALAAGGFALMCWVLEIGRAISKPMNDVLMRFGFFKLIIHPHEHYRVNSATWYATALFVLGLLSPPFATVAGVAALGAGDPIAALVGRRWGRTRLVHGRTAEGSLAFIGAATAAVFLALTLWHPLGSSALRLLVALAAAVTAALVELFSRRLDDNFTVPLAGATGAVGAALGLGLFG